MLLSYGVTNIIGCDRTGAVYRGREGNMNYMKNWFADHTNPDNRQGTLNEVIEGADLFLGLSGPGAVTVHDIQKMGRDPIVFAMANPDPEILPTRLAPMSRSWRREGRILQIRSIMSLRSQVYSGEPLMCRRVPSMKR